ncbi:LOW QUALITY PROTEIN: hypothetical protein TorRG33x02_309920 [Trema orientale]|uniref:Uncharacterized protein n=1 Tax=Trema orientale TaxID=63057 RepID=A0A2P5BT11_TREOI|nr:LOW QUALITY PROTEIN: hypothetical protein TorRG33x02_309920 [Trema orientale]
MNDYGPLDEGFDGSDRTVGTCTGVMRRTDRCRGLVLGRRRANEGCVVVLPVLSVLFWSDKMDRVFNI